MASRCSGVISEAIFRNYLCKLQENKDGSSQELKVGNEKDQDYHWNSTIYYVASGKLFNIIESRVLCAYKEETIPSL